MKRRWRKLYGMSATIICPYCLKEVPLSETNMDHILPRGRFHDNSPDNIVRCCIKCNSEKGCLTPEEYAEWKRLNFIRNGGLSRQK